MREPPIYRAVHSASSARRIATALHAAFIVLVLLVSPSCIALENRDMDDLFQRVGVGTPIVIVGPRGSEAVTF